MESTDKLLDLRGDIDKIDAEIIHILAMRFQTVQKIKKLKHEKNLPVLDEKRQVAHKKMLQELGEKSKLNQDFIGELFEIIFKNSVKEQLS